MQRASMFWNGLRCRSKLRRTSFSDRQALGSRERAAQCRFERHRRKRAKSGCPRQAKLTPQPGRLVVEIMAHNSRLQARSVRQGRTKRASSTQSRADELGKKNPRPIARAGRFRSLAVGLAAARPDQAVAVAFLVVEEVGVDRCGEARIVELEGEILSALVGALRPGGADLSLMRCTALSRLCGARVYAESGAVSGGFAGLWRWRRSA